MIPRLGDGNVSSTTATRIITKYSLENDSPSRGRKRLYKSIIKILNKFRK